MKDTLKMKLFTTRQAYLYIIENDKNELKNNCGTE